MNNKIVVLLVLIGLVLIASGNEGERIGNPHEDKELNITVECVLCDTAPNCTNMTPLIIEGGDTVITRELIEGFLCKNGFILFSERAPVPGEICQTWMTPNGEFVSVGLYEELNDYPRLIIRDLETYELKLNEVNTS